MGSHMARRRFESFFYLIQSYETLDKELVHKKRYVHATEKHSLFACSSREQSAPQRIRTT